MFGLDREGNVQRLVAEVDVAFIADVGFKADGERRIFRRLEARAIDEQLGSIPTERCSLPVVLEGTPFMDLQLDIGRASS